jgi:glycine/D-amino acid oxidase-like deaminating enzyme
VNRPSIAVIGGGILGCLIAREIITREPDAHVTVLDRDAVGSGASRRSAGLHFPRGSSDRVRQMSAYSEDYYDRLLKSQPDLPIYPSPMSVVASRNLADELRHVYLDRAGLTETADTGSADVVLDSDLRAWSGSGCHYADVQALALALAHPLRARVAFREGVAVTGLAESSSAVRLRLGTGDEISVSRVVLAPGPWANIAPWRDLTSQLGIRVKKVVALHIERPPRPGAPCVVFEEEDAFLLPVTHRGHLLFSYTCQEWDVDPDALHQGLTADHLGAAQAVLKRYAPSLTSQCVSGRVFCDAYSPDRQPVVRTLDAHARIVYAGAANGSGYRLGPAMAAAAADLLDLPY